MRARAGHSPFTQALWEGLKHLPAIIVFFSGITYHVAASILAFFFSVAHDLAGDQQGLPADFDPRSRPPLLALLSDHGSAVVLFSALCLPPRWCPLVGASARSQSSSALFGHHDALPLPDPARPWYPPQVHPRYYAAKPRRSSLRATSSTVLTPRTPSRANSAGTLRTRSSAAFSSRQLVLHRLVAFFRLVQRISQRPCGTLHAPAALLAYFLQPSPTQQQRQSRRCRPTASMRNMNGQYTAPSPMQRTPS